MTFRKLFLLGGAFFFLAEPFLVQASFFLEQTPQQVCSSCGMRDICGPVCCCGVDETCGTGEGTEGPAFRAAGCSQEKPLLAFGFSDMTKFLPAPSGPLFHGRPSIVLALAPTPLPSRGVAPLSPPPEMTARLS